MAAQRPGASQYRSVRRDTDARPPGEALFPVGRGGLIEGVMTGWSAAVLVVSIVAVTACGDGAVAPDVWPHTVLPPCTQSIAQTITLPVAGYISVDPSQDSGCVLLPTASLINSVEYLVVPQSASNSSGKSAPFQLKGGSLPAGVTAQLVGPAAAGQPVPGSVAIQFDQFLRTLAHTRNYAVPLPTPAIPGGKPPGMSFRAQAAAGPPALGDLRTFRVCNVLTCKTLSNVTARVKAVGMHIAVYVDTLAPTAGLDSAELDTLKQVFDTRLYPLDTAAFGGISDIDSNTVAIVLMTGTVNHLVTAAQCNSAGFVAGFFFSGDLDPAFRSQYNQGEIFYSIVADPNGTLSCPHTTAQVKSLMPVTFTHEFQHMINFVQHVLVRTGQAEEGWMDEGLSRYAEELGGRSYLPADQASFSQFAIGDVYDAYQYLAATGDSPLLIPQDNGTLADAGASWLFVRYLVDQLRTDTTLAASHVVTRKLVQSNVTGATGVAAQTGQAFEATLSRWAAANWVSDLPGFTAPPELEYTSWHFRTTYASLHTQDPGHFPQPYPLVPVASAGPAVNVSATLRSGSGVYVRALQAPGDSPFVLRFSGGGTKPLSRGGLPPPNLIRIP